MFTGLVECLAPLADLIPEPPGKRIIVRQASFAKEAELGESIAINGCCLTVVAINGDTLTFQAGPETLARTNLGDLTLDSSVNLERSLKIGDRLGGHFVTGHVDAVGTLLERHDDGDWVTLWFGIPRELGRQMVSKGSVSVDGVSLTLVEVDAERFSVALIPHTLEVTTLGRLDLGAQVNLETDMLAKLVQKQLAGNE